MDLIDINQMQQKLDEQFIPLEPTITGMRLVIKKNQKPSLEQCEVVLKVTFPASFSDLTSHYDFGHFTIGPITFCDSGNYFLWLTGINTDEMQTYAWWSGFKRPKGVIMIANSDPYAIILDTNTVHIFAFMHGEEHMVMHLIATRFDLFILGVGTAMLNRKYDHSNDVLAQDIAREVGAESNDKFWQFITS